MAKKNRFRAEGKSHEPASMPQEPSTISPLPFYPNLRRALRSNTATILLIYLESYWPSPQDDEKGPVLVDLYRTRVDLQLNVRRFREALSYVSALYRWPAQMVAAQRAGRMFYRATGHHSGNIKCYATLPDDTGTFKLWRNFGRLRSLFAAVNATYPLPQFVLAQSCQQIREPEDDRVRGTCENSVDLESEIRDHIAETPRNAALALSKSLSVPSLITDGRMRPGLVRAEHTRRPWTPERRARWEATTKAKAAAKCQKTRENTLDGTDGTIGTITNVEWQEENVLARKCI